MRRCKLGSIRACETSTAPPRPRCAWSSRGGACHDRIRTCQHDGKEYESMRSGDVTAKKRACDSVRAREHGSLRALAPRMSASSNLNAPLASFAGGAWRRDKELKRWHDRMRVCKHGIIRAFERRAEATRTRCARAGAALVMAA